MKTKLCNHCGLEFQTDHGGKLYCGTVCSQSSKKEKRKHYKKQERKQISVSKDYPGAVLSKCIVCENEFYARTNRATVCSFVCHDKRWRSNNREKVLERYKKYDEKRRPQKMEYDRQRQRRKRAEIRENPEEYKKFLVESGNRATAHLQRLLKFKRRYKLYCGCCVCGYKKSAVALQFHHKDGADKKNCVANLKGMKKIREEIKKCVVLCANCHAVITYKDITIEELRHEKQQ